MPPVTIFLDKNEMLSSKYARDNDPIQLGNRGLAVLIRIIKTSIFVREKHGNHTSHQNCRAHDPKVGAGISRKISRKH